MSDHPVRCRARAITYKGRGGGMSRKGKNKKQRVDRDAYMTPPPLARGVCKQLAEYLEPERIIEPSAGQGNFVRAAREVWPNARIIAVDIHKAYEKACLAAGADEFICADTLDYLDYTGTRGADLVLG